MDAIRYREATLNDLPTLRVFEQGVVEAERPYNATLKPGPANYYDLEALLADEASLLLVAQYDNTLIASGYATLRSSLKYLRHERHAYLGFMYVLPDFRGNGIVQALMRNLLAWSRRKGVADAYLDVYAENDAAIRAYEKFGFQRNLIEMKLNEQD